MTGYVAYRLLEATQIFHRVVWRGQVTRFCPLVIYKPHHIIVTGESQQKWTWFRSHGNIHQQAAAGPVLYVTGWSMSPLVTSVNKSVTCTQHKARLLYLLSDIVGMFRHDANDIWHT